MNINAMLNTAMGQSASVEARFADAYELIKALEKADLRFTSPYYLDGPRPLTVKMEPDRQSFTIQAGATSGPYSRPRFFRVGMSEGMLYFGGCCGINDTGDTEAFVQAIVNMLVNERAR